MKKEFIFIEKNIVNVVQLKPSQNQKIGFGIAIFTYHFSIEQIENIDLKLDKENCLDCPLSYSTTKKIGTCYTHKGTQKMGLNSMLKRLNKLHKANLLETFNEVKYNKFLSDCKKTSISLVRFGAYGEAIFLGEKIVSDLAKFAPHTAYTHQYKRKKYSWSNKFFMSSTHNESDRINAKLRGFRSFSVIDKNDTIKNSVNCLASKESKTDSSCITCKLCNGTKTNIKKDVYIYTH
jgi:hypothetical protein